MNKADYPIIIQTIAPEDGGGYLALAPDLCGCMGDGDTQAEAVACLLEAMDEWADEMGRLGRAIPVPYSVADKFREEESAVRKLVEAQAALIERQKQALDDQDASLKELRDQVDALTLGIDAGGGLLIGGRIFGGPVIAGACPSGDKWRNSVLMEAAGSAMPIVRRSHAH